VGGADPVMVATLPSRPAPNPNPATAVLTNSSATEVSSTASSVPTIPTISSTQLATSTSEGRLPRSDTAEIAPHPVRRVTTRAVTSRFDDPVSSAASDGPSERCRPLSAHTATRHGVAARNAGRATGGTPTRGRSIQIRIGRHSTGSGMNHSATAPAANPASSSTKTSRDGAGPYCTRAPAASAPTAWPEVGPPVVTTEASGRPGGWRSSSAALSAPVASPVAKPCTARAA